MNDPIENIMIGNEDVSSGDTVFRDMTMLALSGFIIIVLLLLPWLNIKDKVIMITHLRKLNPMHKHSCCIHTI